MLCHGEVSVPFNKTRCGVDFYINTAINKDIGLVLTENKRFKTDFFSFYMDALLCHFSGWNHHRIHL